MRAILVCAVVVLAALLAAFAYNSGRGSVAAPSSDVVSNEAGDEQREGDFTARETSDELSPLQSQGETSGDATEVDGSDVMPLNSGEGAFVGEKLPVGMALLDFVNGLKPGVVTVVMNDADGLEVASGSGFLLAETVVVANYQVAARGVSGRVILDSGESVPIESVVAENKDANLVLLSITPGSHLDRAKLKPLDMAKATPDAGDEVLMMSRAVDRDKPTVALGTVTGAENIGAIGEALGVEMEFLAGSTGSPVFNAGGQVVGVAAFRSEAGSTRKFVLSASSLMALRVGMEAATPVALADYHAAWVSTFGPEAREAAEPVKLEATIVKQDDGSLLIDDQYILRGSGTQEDPYILTWDHLVSAVKVYKPREGKTELPERIKMLHDKWVKLTGYVAFPLMAQSSDELLLMLNQWDGCCIGVPPTPYDAVEVRLVAPMEMQGGLNIFNYGSITGLFKVDPYVVSDWLVGLYMMEQSKLELEM